MKLRKLAVLGVSMLMAMGAVGCTQSASTGGTSTTTKTEAVKDTTNGSGIIIPVIAKGFNHQCCQAV